jgi:hypothetical protein
MIIWILAGLFVMSYTMEKTKEENKFVKLAIGLMSLKLYLDFTDVLFGYGKIIIGVE